MRNGVFYLRQEDLLIPNYLRYCVAISLEDLVSWNDLREDLFVSDESVFLHSMSEGFHVQFSLQSSSIHHTPFSDEIMDWQISTEADSSDID